MNPVEQFARLQAGIIRKIETHKLEHYKPYPFQVKFHNAEGHLTPGELAHLKALICANQIGKTWCAGYETAMHLTGKYPEWWKGHRFWYPVDCVVAGVTNDLTRDHPQKILLGDPDEGDRAIGTGTVPIECIGKITRKAGVPNAIDSVLIKSITGGWSKVQFKAYEMGFKKFMGKARDVTWFDEEPPSDVLSQAVRSTFAKKKSVIMLTLTPEEGMTQVVAQLLNDIQKGQAVVTATWDDAPHMTKEVRANKLASIPAHERDMRSKGTPLAGAGVIFNIPDEKLLVDPFEISKHWRRIIGIDFGWDHPFGAAELAWDMDADVIYVVADYRESKALPAVHASVVNKWGEWIPVMWPHDGLNTEKGTGEALIDQYRLAHVNVWHEKATNPPAPGDDEGKGGNSVEAPLLEMIERMHTGRWKVFKTCRNFIEEKRMYHRDLNMKIVKYADDVISAARYAYMMRRHAITPYFTVKERPVPLGASNW
jgi:phage terminase large subunit-like protein